MKNIFVYGGCISRDIFNEPYNKGELNLSTYIARYSLAKLWSNPVKINIDEKKLSSPFQRRMVEIDAKNNLLAFVKLREYDHLLMDFMFTRFRLVEYKNTLLTYSTELKKTGLITSSNKSINPETSLYWEYFVRGLDLFLEELSSINQLDKLVVNKVFLAEKDNAGVFFLDTKETNDFLNKIYLLLESRLEKNQLLEYNPKLFIADIDHRWGRNSMHYISEFYDESYRKLASL